MLGVFAALDAILGLYLFFESDADPLISGD